jgi:predicted nucleic acid-binding protein
MVIVDSSVWIGFLRGSLNAETAWLRKAAGAEQIGLTSLIFCEVLQGTLSDAGFQKTREYLIDLPIYTASGAALATTSAQNFRTLRKRGITIRSTVDCMIATFCIESGYRLLHRDRDFDAFEANLGLKVLHPPAALNP